MTIRLYEFGKLEFVNWDNYIKGDYSYWGTEEGLDGNFYDVIRDNGTGKFFCTREV